MHYVIKNTEHLNGIIKAIGQSVPKSVLQRIKQTVETLDAYYGSDRDIEKDLGGFSAVFLSSNNEDITMRYNILRKYNFSENDYEYSDIIFASNGLEWREELFVSSDYNIVIFYQKM